MLAYIAGLSLTGVGDRLQTYRGRESEQFDSACPAGLFLASMAGFILRIIKYQFKAFSVNC